MKKVLSISMILFLMVVTSFAQESAEITVNKIEVATAIEDRVPTGVDTSFAADVQKLYCYTQLTSSEETTDIVHVWYFGDKEMAKINLTMRAKSWRTWSSKNIMSEWKGEWKVEVQDAAGTVLATKSFKIQ